MNERVRAFFGLAGELLFPLFVYEIALAGVPVAAAVLGIEMAPERQLPLAGASAAVTAMVLAPLYAAGGGDGMRGLFLLRQRHDSVIFAAAGAKKLRRLTPAAPVYAACITGGAASCLFFNGLLRLAFGAAGISAAVSGVLRAGSPLARLLCAAALLPAAEELIFRGFAFRSLRRRLPAWPAAVFSALYFALWHGSLLQGIYAFFAGLLLALVLEKTDRLSAAFSFHAAANLAAVLMMAFK